MGSGDLIRLTRPAETDPRVPEVYPGPGDFFWRGLAMLYEPDNITHVETTQANPDTETRPMTFTHKATGETVQAFEFKVKAIRPDWATGEGFDIEKELVGRKAPFLKITRAFEDWDFAWEGNWVVRRASGRVESVVAASFRANYFAA